ncbi:unnamed protein product [Thlaspi arvense]|uniref:Uncharacterized protein n=1 Tax=Thlaspi arvense TaxID=13288 RepID=A0AAU9S0B3_THLAR|nr:unnamed protein product [Thlaspi arvense]
MKNCSLDLCLSPVTSSLQSFRRDSTINAFYNEKLREYDLVEIQIRAVIEMAASKERETTALELAPVSLGLPFGSSVKRSVKRFLEKRKKKSKTVTPHIYTYTSTSSSSSHNF